MDRKQLFSALDKTSADKPLFVGMSKDSSLDGVDKRGHIPAGFVDMMEITGVYEDGDHIFIMTESRPLRIKKVTP